MSFIKRNWFTMQNLVLIALLLLFYTSEFKTLADISEEIKELKSRNPKFFPFFLTPSFVRFPNEPCLGENGLKGTCFSRLECLKYGGFSSGTCAKGLGSCCILKKTCGQSSHINCTYFLNPEYPASYKGSGIPCTLSISKCNKEICQLRLDFIDFTLAEPDALGRCTNDFALISGAASNFRRICGTNSGQHVYLDFSGDAPIELLIDINTAVTAERKWNIKISQVECCKRAPSGCLMHYASTSGKVKSFNYSPMQSTAPEDPSYPGPGTRLITDFTYGICIQMLPGYCYIEWTANINDKYSFTMSGDTEALDPTILGTTMASEMGMTCTTNFVIIPNPVINGTPAKSDRFCGNGFPTVVSSSKPFVLTVVTNAAVPTESPDVGNRGFCLHYRQLPCD